MDRKLKPLFRKPGAYNEDGNWVEGDYVDANGNEPSAKEIAAWEADAEVRTEAAHEQFDREQGKAVTAITVAGGGSPELVAENARLTDVALEAERAKTEALKAQLEAEKESSKVKADAEKAKLEADNAALKAQLEAEKESSKVKADAEKAKLEADNAALKAQLEAAQKAAQADAKTAGKTSGKADEK
jgi:hypothetical protein